MEGLAVAVVVVEVEFVLVKMCNRNVRRMDYVLSVEKFKHIRNI